MIVNTLKKRLKLTIALVLTAGLAATLPACKSLFFGNNSDENGLEFQQKSENFGDGSGRLALLSLTVDDYQGLSSRGAPVQWQPVLMPLRNGIILTDRAFALGLTGQLGNIEGKMPELGECQRLSNSSTSIDLPNSSTEKAVSVELELTDEAGHRRTGTGGQLFLIHEQVSRFVRAIGFWNDEGRAICSLPIGRWFLSTGFGEARTHKPFVVSSNRENKVSLRALPRARLIIRPGRDTGLNFGDLMRIGRIRTPQPAAQSADQLPEVPLLIQDDLIRPTMTPSENSGVREYLFTSLFLHRPEFTLPIEPGEYSIGLWRDGQMKPCVTRIVIQPTDVAVLACDPEFTRPTQNAGPLANSIDGQSLAFSDSSNRSFVFDGSFLPSRLVNNNSLRAWMAKNGVNRFLRAGRSLDSQQLQIQFLLQPFLQAFPSDSVIPPEGPFIGDFRINQKSEFDEQLGRSPFVRLLHAQSGLNLDSLFARVFKSNFSNTIPLAGISERGLLEGVVPLTFRTTLRTSESRKIRTEETEAFVSNGAQIDWIDPTPTVSGTPLRLGPQQRVRMRLKVPPEDTTEFFTMFVNGERYKQWSVPLSQYRNMTRTLEIDEKITQSNDFYLGFASWGKTYLPEFMFGVRQLPAIGFTRNYCIDVNENAVCDRQ